MTIVIVDSPMLFQLESLARMFHMVQVKPFKLLLHLSNNSNNSFCFLILAYRFSSSWPWWIQGWAGVSTWWLLETLFFFFKSSFLVNTRISFSPLNMKSPFVTFLISKLITTEAVGKLNKNQMLWWATGRTMFVGKIASFLLNCPVEY